MQEADRHEIGWTSIEFHNSLLYIAATNKGLCYVGSPGQKFEEFAAQMMKRFPGAELSEQPEGLRQYTAELAEYLAGEKNTFSIPVAAKGTAFQEEVWTALKSIPYGETCSYGEIAERIGRPAAVRAVGTAIGSNPVLITIPCHRVVGKNGSLTGYRGGIEMKQALLQLEREHSGFSGRSIRKV